MAWHEEKSTEQRCGSTVLDADKWCVCRGAGTPCLVLADLTLLSLWAQHLLVFSLPRKLLKSTDLLSTAQQGWGDAAMATSCSQGRVTGASGALWQLLVLRELEDTMAAPAALLALHGCFPAQTGVV